MNEALPGQAGLSTRSRDARAASSAGAEISIKSVVSVHSSAARTACLGIKLAQNRPIQRELADIGRRGLGRGRGRGVVGLEIDDQNFVRRHHQPVDLARKPAPAAARQVRAGRRSATSARLPSAKTGANRGSAISASTFSASVVALGIAPGGRIARKKFLRGLAPAVRRQGRAADCSSRCTSVPRCSARVRCAIDSPDLDSSANWVRRRIRRTQQDDHLGRSRGADVRSQSGSSTSRARGCRRRAGR